jgi:hypothetical protein
MGSGESAPQGYGRAFSYRMPRIVKKRNQKEAHQACLFLVSFKNLLTIG